VSSGRSIVDYFSDTGNLFYSLFKVCSVYVMRSVVIALWFWDCALCAIVLRRVLQDWRAKYVFVPPYCHHSDAFIPDRCV